jgi:hypothetical protein
MNAIRFQWTSSLHKELVLPYLMVLQLKGNLKKLLFSERKQNVLTVQCSV